MPAPEPDDDDEAEHDAADQAALVAQQVGDGLIRLAITVKSTRGSTSRVSAMATTASRMVTKQLGFSGRADPAGPSRAAHPAHHPSEGVTLHRPLRHVDETANVVVPQTTRRSTTAYG